MFAFGFLVGVGLGGIAGVVGIYVLRDKADSEAYDDGYEDGRAEGYSRGYTAGWVEKARQDWVPGPRLGLVAPVVQLFDFERDGDTA